MRQAKKNIPDPGSIHAHRDIIPGLTYIEEYRWDPKYLSSSVNSNPKKIIPSRFLVPIDGHHIVLTYRQLVIESPKSLVCRYENRYQSRNKLNKSYIVKFQLKFQNMPWSSRVLQNIHKRYYNQDRGDMLCHQRLEKNSRLCPFLGTFLLSSMVPQERLDQTPKDILKAQSEICASARGEPEGFVIQIFEDLSGGDLYSFLVSKEHVRDNILTLHNIARDICEGMHEFHSKDMYHGDMKPENVMITNDAGGVRAVLIDFDFASRIDQDRLKRGTPRYLPPEYIQAYRGHRKLPELGRLGREFDMWAVGAILWSMFYGSRNKFYVTSYNSDDLKSDILSSKVIQQMLREDEYKLVIKKAFKTNNRSVHPAMESLIKRLLNYEPTERPTALECVQVIDEAIKELNLN